MGYDMSVEADGTYFRLNVWGMSDYRDAMEQAGMLHWAEDGNAPWPKRADYATEEEYIAAANEYRDRESGGVIPGHKLCSNDGWLVTESECKAALAAWHDYCDNGGVLLGIEDDREYWNKWIAYLEHASTHGGFRVW